MSGEIRFAASNSYRVSMALGACLIAIFLVGVLHERMGVTLYGAPFGIALAMYFTYPIYFVTPDSLIFKYGLSKQAFPFNRGPFVLERLSGFKSYMQSFQPKSYRLRVPAKKNRGIVLVLPDAEVAALIMRLRGAGAVVEGDAPVV